MQRFLLGRYQGYSLGRVPKVASTQGQTDWLLRHPEFAAAGVLPPLMLLEGLGSRLTLDFKKEICKKKTRNSLWTFVKEGLLMSALLGCLSVRRGWLLLMTKQIKSERIRSTWSIRSSSRWRQMSGRQRDHKFSTVNISIKSVCSPLRSHVFHISH